LVMPQCRAGHAAAQP